MAHVVKTEHAGAKNGGGMWGRRVVAKSVSRQLRRAAGKQAIRDELRATPSEAYGPGEKT